MRRVYKSGADSNRLAHKLNLCITLNISFCLFINVSADPLPFVDGQQVVTQLDTQIRSNNPEPLPQVLPQVQFAITILVSLHTTSVLIISRCIVSPHFQQFSRTAAWRSQTAPTTCTCSLLSDGSEQLRGALLAHTTRRILFSSSSPSPPPTPPLPHCCIFPAFSTYSLYVGLYVRHMSCSTATWWRHNTTDAATDTRGMRHTATPA